MEREAVRKNIENALYLIYRVDLYLIESNTHEQSISARLAFHLQHLFPEWDVDVEYNRQGGKRDPKEDGGGLNRRPDIIIHKRGPAGPNLAILLVKCEWNTQDRDTDEEVLISLKQKHQYQNAFLIEIKKNSFSVEEK